MTFQIDDSNVIASFEELPKFLHLKTLVLKAFASPYIVPLLRTNVGPRLRRLDLHYNYAAPGINLIEIGDCCPLLCELSVSDSMVTTTSASASAESSKLIFKRLTSIKLLRVSYSHPDDWEKILRYLLLNK